MNKTKPKSNPLVGVIMGSHSDWETLSHCIDILKEFKISYETRVVSAHRTPQLLYKYSSEAEKRGLKIIIAGAGGAAHLPGMTAAITLLPVIGVPIESSILNGIDSLLSIVQMPSGVPVSTMAIGKHGAINAALSAIRILAIEDVKLRENLRNYHNQREEKILSNPDPSKSLFMISKKALRFIIWGIFYEIFEKKSSK